MMRVALSFLLTVAVCSAGAEESRPAGQWPPDPLPAGWKIISHANVPPDQATTIGNKLGVKIKALSNTRIALDGQPIVVNVMTCDGTPEAQKAFQTLLKAHQGMMDFVLRRPNDTVVEFSRASVSLARRARYALGLSAKVVTYRVTFDAAPLAKVDDMEWNNFFNLFLQLEQEPASKEIAGRIAALSGKFQFGDSISLRAVGQGSAPTQWSFRPEPSSSQALGAGDLTRFTLAGLPQKAGVPCVAVTGTITSEAFGVVPARRQDLDGLLAPTEFWPVADPEVKELAQKITAKFRSDQEKVTALLAWFAPGANLRYGGPVVGSRYGVKVVLKQGFGHCWDFSDCFVALCRAAGVPARQVTGWLYGQCGHVWAEVLIDGAWRQVDPTANADCTTDYVPILTTETGECSLLYLGMPKITIVNP